MTETLKEIVALINVVLPGLPEDQLTQLKNDVMTEMCRTGDDMYESMQNMNI